MKTFRFIGAVLFFILLTLIQVSAQEEAEPEEEALKEAKIELTFEKGDSLSVCNVLVTSDGAPAPDVTVQLFVKRLFGLLPVGDNITTDEDGAGIVEFPKDLPGDENLMLEVVAKIEDDENFGNVEATSLVKWGIPKKAVGDINERSLSASRAKAPIYFIVASNLIIIGIWGTLFYVILQIWKIKKLGKAHNTHPKT